jgi:limonene 1,2-monooxygenase
MRFGIFLAPFHPVPQNPTLRLEQDLELIESMDRLGYDEAWIGEHHSGGYEIIASPEVFIAAAAQRTKRIRLGTGVSSLPYHHPFMLCDRMVQLDHMTRGRVMLGCGPGQLTSDAWMLGIDPADQRRMMEESLEVILQLQTSGEPVTRDAGWFRMRDARLQLRPYQWPHIETAVAGSISPSGPKLAGRHGVGLLSIAATSPEAFALLASHWQVVEHEAAKAGKVADRRSWRLMGPMHLADTKERARENVRYGMERIFDYLGHVLPRPERPPMTFEETVDFVNGEGSMVIGTADMAVAQIRRLQEQSGGFGTYLLFGGDLADHQATLRSLEIFARDVMPHFNGQLAPVQASYDWLMAPDKNWDVQTFEAIGRSVAEYAATNPDYTSPLPG